MSILLDALRKSEKDQQKVEAPSIHSGDQSNSPSRRLKKGWWLMIIVVVFTSASYAWYQYRGQEEVLESPAGLALDAGSAEDQQLSSPAGKTDNGKQQAVVSNDAAKKVRTPVEDFQQAAGKSNTAVARQAGTGGNKKPATRKPAAKKPAGNSQVANKQATNKQATNKQAVNKQAANKQAANKQATGGQPANKKAETAKKPETNMQAANKKANANGAANKPATVKSAAAGQKPFRPQLPAPINYWELPDSVRAKVPEMKFSVLVYAKDPADRFVLINGQRYRQGEQVQTDLFVREIRRKGVVFKYRLYKFLVER